MIQVIQKPDIKPPRIVKLREIVSGLAVGGSFKTENPNDSRMAQLSARKLGMTLTVRKDERGGWVVRRVA